MVQRLSHSYTLLPSQPPLALSRSGLLHPDIVHLFLPAQLLSPLPPGSSSAFGQSSLNRRSSLDPAEVFLHGLLLRPSSPVWNALSRASFLPKLRAPSESGHSAGTQAQPHSSCSDNLVWGDHTSDEGWWPAAPTSRQVHSAQRLSIDLWNTVSHVHTPSSPGLALSVHYWHQTTLYLKAASTHMYPSIIYA